MGLGCSLNGGEDVGRAVWLDLNIIGGKRFDILARGNGNESYFDSGHYRI